MIELLRTASTNLVKRSFEKVGTTQSVGTSLCVAATLVSSVTHGEVNLMLITDNTSQQMSKFH